MYSRNVAVRSENNQISELKKPNIDDANMLDPPEEVVPLILSSEIRDVFPSIANYLDIKSFMKLAMASKEMYKRCMEDKRIKIEVHDGELDVAKKDGVDTIDFKSSKVSVAHTSKYLAALSLLPCILHLKSVYLMDDFSVAELRRYLAQLSVKSIKSMSVYDRMIQWTELFPLVEDFHVDSLHISFSVEIPAEHSRTVLQLKISSIVVESFVNLDTLLELNAPITDITLRSHPDIPINAFTDILWKIQISSLNKLNLRFNSFDRVFYPQIPFARGVELPENRPLVFYEDGNYVSNYKQEQIYKVYTQERIYKVLHLDGSVTKCVVVDGETTITKCETSEFPPVLKSDEDVAKDMRKWLPKVSCSEEQFLHFANTLTLVDASDNGPLPDERPLFFFDSFKKYWMLDEDGSLKKYAWSEGFSISGYATCTIFDLTTTWPVRCGHASLAIYIIKAMLQNGLVKDSFSSDLKETDIRSCLNSFKTIPFDYWGLLPDERPLFFERDDVNDKEDGGARVALLENGDIVQCTWRVPPSISHVWGVLTSFTIGPYHVRNLPPVLISKEIFKNMLGSSGVKIGRMELDVFLGAVEGIKTLSFDFEDDLPEERLLVFKPADNGGGLSEKRWFLKDRVVTKCEWNEGRVSLTLENPRDFPLSLTKELVKQHIKKWRHKRAIYFLDFDVFRSCFADFKMISYDSSILLPEDRPLIFEKTEVKEGCNRRDEEGRDLLWTVCFVEEDESLVSFTWGEKEPREVALHGSTRKENIPPSMKSAEYLKYLLEMRKCAGPEDKWKTVWYGDLTDFLAYFKGYISLPFEHEGPLPEGQPFVFYKRDEVFSIYFNLWFPRDDGTVIKCSCCDDYLQIGVTTDIPSALRRRA